MERQAPFSPHIPVLVRETVEMLQVRPHARYVDSTLGLGGHAEAILAASRPDGMLLGIDADPQAIAVASERLHPYSQATILHMGGFQHLEAICAQHHFTPVHGILFDLGVSSLQLGQGGRGFSFQVEAPLDMRYDPQGPVTAADLVNTLPEEELAHILWRYGEEPQSRRIARRIAQRRPLATTVQLAQVVMEAVNGHRTRIHPATRTFQALRIAVNRELEALEAGLLQAIKILDRGGRLAVISFHSLEDRLVKRLFHQEAQACVCPPGTPICVCEHTPRLKVITRKVVTPTPEERGSNPRCRSAKLRVAERL